MSATYSFKGRVVIVTGGSSGIGLEAALRFAASGCDGLALVGRNEERLKESADACEKKGLTKDKVLLIPADMALDGSPQKIIDAVISKFGRIDVLINNAAIGGVSTLESKNLLEIFDNVYAVNLRSILILSQLAIPYLIQTKGSIVNVSSICSKVAVPNMLAYNLSKKALDRFTESAAMELAPKQVRVNAVNPGTIITPMHVRSGRSLDHVKELAKALHPMGRAGEVDDVAKAILFFASDEASFTTGETFSVDGGRFLLTAWD